MLRKVVKKECFVPSCENDSENSPEKLFYSVPRKNPRRTAWFLDVGNKNLTSTQVYCCEDHFNLAEDSKNWWAYNAYQQRLVLKNDVVPHLYIRSRPPRVLPSQLSEPDRKRRNREFLAESKHEPSHKKPKIVSEIHEPSTSTFTPDPLGELSTSSWTNQGSKKRQDSNDASTVSSAEDQAKTVLSSTPDKGDKKTEEMDADQYPFNVIWISECEDVIAEESTPLEERRSSSSTGNMDLEAHTCSSCSHTIRALEEEIIYLREQNETLRAAMRLKVPTFDLEKFSNEKKILSHTNSRANS